MGIVEFFGGHAADDASGDGEEPHVTVVRAPNGGPARAPCARVWTTAPRDSRTLSQVPQAARLSWRPTARLRAEIHRGDNCRRAIVQHRQAVAGTDHRKTT